MAIVADTGRPGNVADKSFCKENRTNSTLPIGSLTPQYRGELVRALDTGVMYRGTGVVNNTDWEVVRDNV